MSRESTPAADRLPPIPPDRLTVEQQAAARAFEASRGTGVFGPFVPLLRSPELLVRAGAVGEYLRFESVLPARLRELAILVTAREWTQQVEWDIHVREAADAGLPADLIHAIADGRRPESMDEDVEVLYDFCVELHQTKAIGDRTYERASRLLGERALVEAIVTCGYYTLLAMVLNVARTPLPAGRAPVLVTPARSDDRHV